MDEKTLESRTASLELQLVELRARIDAQTATLQHIERRLTIVGVLTAVVLTGSKVPWQEVVTAFGW